MRNFQLKIEQTRSYDGSTYDYFPSPATGQNPWTVTQSGKFLEYVIQGFKNIDLYGIKMMGYVQSPVITTTAGIVEDFSFTVDLNAQQPQVSGIITNDDYNGSVGSNVVQLSKFQNEIMLTEPLTSLKSLSINTFRAQGIGAQSSLEIQLNLNFQFYFYYKYEGE